MYSETIAGTGIVWDVSWRLKKVMHRHQRLLLRQRFSTKRTSKGGISTLRTNPGKLLTTWSQSRWKWQRRSTALVRSPRSPSRRMSLSEVACFSLQYPLQDTHQLIRIRGGDLLELRTYIKTVCTYHASGADLLSLHDRYLNRYTELNYLFDLNKSLSLDALTVGNETRYLNHNRDSNVTAFGRSRLLFP